MFGQSSRRSRSRSRRFVRNRMILEGPDSVCGCGADVTGFKVLLGAIRKLLDRASEELLVEEDILRKERYFDSIITCYLS
jgi:hypothetical protein